MSTLRERPLRILAADDSAVMRSILWKLFLMQKGTGRASCREWSCAGSRAMAWSAWSR